MVIFYLFIISQSIGANCNFNNEKKTNPKRLEISLVLMVHISKMFQQVYFLWASKEALFKITCLEMSPAILCST